MVGLSINTQGAKLRSADGKTYTAHATIIEETLNVHGPFPAVETLTVNVGFNQPGPGNNFVAHITLHVTVNGDGKISAVVTNVDVDCR